MAAPNNNQFWKLRSKHGRDKIFKTADIMLKACYEYFEYQSTQVWEKTDFKGKEAIEVKIPISSPFTVTGLCIFLGVNTVYFAQFEKDCDDDFSKVITHVREIIYTQKFEGAAVGTYNGNIIARDLGLADKQEVDVNSNKEEDLSIYTTDELIKRVAAIKTITKNEAK